MQISQPAKCLLVFSGPIDMIGFGIVIPFLTYLVEDLAAADGIKEVGLWVKLP